VGGGKEVVATCRVGGANHRPIWVGGLGAKVSGVFRVRYRRRGGGGAVACEAAA